MVTLLCLTTERRSGQRRAFHHQHFVWPNALIALATYYRAAVSAKATGGQGQWAEVVASASPHDRPNRAGG